ncbi:hypothetical protein ABT095_15600 [Kitasatospora sp. NPDC002227]|uniref:hypothetical protein n=1 Tax=Kitasatospora sp. NPDC002227 TaxID=3154773 RepID=UPI003317CF38
MTEELEQTPEVEETAEQEQEQEQEQPKPQRGRTARLLVAALLLGPLAGAGVGYAVQAARPATALPPLAVAAPAYPSAALDAKAAAEAAPKALNIDGDLRKLLIAKPADAESWDDFGRGELNGWLSVGEKAMNYGGADREFGRLLSGGFRRDALVVWKKGDTKYEVELIQYAAGHASSAVDAVDSRPSDVHPIEGTSTGFYSAAKTPKTYAESTEQYYAGTAVAHRGDVVMRISVFSPNPVDENELKDLAKRQWERLV